MSEERRGFLFGVAAYGLWGLFPLYWPLLEPASAVEILAHRVVWSVGFVLGLLWLRRRAGNLRAILTERRTRWILTFAAGVLAINWWTYIWGVNHGHVVETSLGYFITPLISVLLGVVVLHERLRAIQWFAVGIGTLAVVVLTLDYARPPWLALILAVSFGSYGLARRRLTSARSRACRSRRWSCCRWPAYTCSWCRVQGEGHFATRLGPCVAADRHRGHHGRTTAVFRRSSNPCLDDHLGMLQYLAPFDAVRPRAPGVPRDDVDGPLGRFRPGVAGAVAADRRVAGQPAPRRVRVLAGASA
jgi:chloramphenicol-sensitive protein RarD